MDGKQHQQIIIMNFFRGLVQYMGAQHKPPQPPQITKEPSSANFEVIVIDDEENVPGATQPTQILRDPTRYYMIQNEFFNNIIVEKEQYLKILTLQEWGIVLKNKSLENICQKNLIFSIMKGIPKEVRKEFWEILADTNKMKQEFKLNYYQLLESGEGKNKDIIVKDVPRTKVDERHREKLCNILTAYSNVDKMGYTQGMNLICGSLLNILSSESNTDQDPELEAEEIGFEEKVFWVFMGIMYGKNWRECFEEMRGVKRMLEELESLMQRHTPEILWHIKELELDLNMCFAQYYLTLIIYNTPIELATIILDLFLLEGERVIHSLILKMLIACREKILAIDDMGMLIRFFKTDMLHFCDSETKKQCQSAESLQDFIINFFTLSNG